VSRKEAELHQAWDLYYHVFKRINKQLHSLTTLELQYVAPALVSLNVNLISNVVKTMVCQKVWCTGDCAPTHCDATRGRGPEHA
jgi:hypothetical protein